ncbi:MAG: Uma2 family endonuclease [Acidobacteriota bacterium]
MLHHSTSPPRFNYGDYCRWQGDERWELIDGEAFDMSPAPSRRHQQVLLRLAQQIDSGLKGQACEVYVAPFDVRLPAADEADEQIETVVQPDISVVCDPTKLDDAGCRGAPDWILEILSPRTAARDQLHKRDLYGLHGVREYWIVDPEHNRVTIYRSAQPGSGFSAATEVEGQSRIRSQALPEVEIDLAPVFR